ncbi:MAG: hypothetical protein PHX79_03270, partial [Sphaerochaetaceae bacterium]|nr:hypothetical protein [Sphaerochaetaceae bacterium]
ITYTAPASNANCTSNPTITVTCGGSTIGTLTIAVNAYSSDVNAYSKGVPLNEFDCWFTPSMCRWICAAAETAYYNCSGTLRYIGTPKFSCGPGGGIGIGGASCNGYPGVDCCSSDTSWCLGRKAQYCTTCSTAAEAAANLPLTDLRTENQKANGCCPAQLL